MSTIARWAIVAGVVVACAACAGSPSAAPSPSSSPSSPGTSPPAAPTPSRTATFEPPRYSTWSLGERVLPLRADGYGEVRPTPASLRRRRYPTIDLLPPPSGRRFVSSIGPITPTIRDRMGETYAPGCPVGLDGLRYVRVSFRGFDGDAHTGELVVAAAQARGIASVFRALYEADYPIEEMRLPTTADLDAPSTGDGNDTAAFVCRATTGTSTTLSAHAYGLALDLNPFVNPYERGDLVLPERASSYLDRARRRPGMVYDGGLVVREFARIGWSWGGDFSSLKDYQHFTATGR